MIMAIQKILQTRRRRNARVNFEGEPCLLQSLTTPGNKQTLYFIQPPTVFVRHTVTRSCSAPASPLPSDKLGPSEPCRGLEFGSASMMASS
ncbi:unnamed protein product [Protopolystoma xenopodis]|uniref:Uncharacterized protein n=1 Tax=Protopolystoma xenopodis TaxID=117903 RepID=A0A3S5FGD2_9PLAT|nr:unnamed protein product [Protopolystoma xenopodis]